MNLERMAIFVAVSADLADVNFLQLLAICLDHLVSFVLSCACFASFLLGFLRRVVLWIIGTRFYIVLKAKESVQLHLMLQF
jgi:hypothetical protein